MNEIWKDIPSCPGYKASSLGRIAGFKNKILKGSSINGYLLFRCKTKNMRVHRAVCEAFLGYSKLEVDHINGNRTDNRLENLRYVTSKENYANARRLGTNCAGERHGRAKLSIEDVYYIRKNYRQYSGNRSNKKEIAEKFGVSKAAIDGVIYRMNWRNLPERIKNDSKD